MPSSASFGSERLTSERLGPEHGTRGDLCEMGLPAVVRAPMTGCEFLLGAFSKTVTLRWHGTYLHSLKIGPQRKDRRLAWVL